MADPNRDETQSLDQTTLEAWSKTFRTPLINFFHRHGAGTSQESEDLVQEVLERLAKRADISKIERPDGYIFQTARSVLIDRVRRDQVREHEAHTPYEEDVHGLMGLTPERVLEGKQALQSVIDALHELPERTRIVFLLYHFENVRQTDIAKRLGIGLSTVELHMAKANKHLMKRKARLT